MNTMQILGGSLMASAGVVVLVVLVVGGVALRGRGSRSALAYLTEESSAVQITGSVSPVQDMESVVERVLRPLAKRLTSSVRRMYPSANLDRMHAQLLQAGLSTSIRAEEFATVRLLAFGIGLAMAVLLFLAGPGSSAVRLLLGLVLAVVAAIGPGAWLGGRVKARSGAVSRDIPDMLDLLTISVEAGLGLEAAIETSCSDIESPLANELARTLQEMNLGLSRHQAFENLKLRTGSEELKTFVLILAQADALGMPIGRVLRTQADEMRDRRRARAREQAAKLPVKILFPLMLFIMPPLMILILGPAAISIVGHLP